MNKKGGFTLIEILIVVGIIGLLASVVLSGLGSVRGRGRDARRAADLRQVQQGLELYYARCQRYPGAADCGAGDPSDWAGLKESLSNSGLGVTSLSSDPLYADDSSRNYRYAVSQSGQSYILAATLEDENSPLLKDSYAGGGESDYNGASIDCTARLTYCIKF